MKWAIIGPAYPFRGGIAHYTTLLTRHLSRQHEATLYSFVRQYPTWLYPGRSDRDLSQWTWDVPCHRIIDPLLPWTWFQAARLIRQQSPDGLIVQWWVPYWSPCLSAICRLVRARTSTKIAFICHNVLPHEPGYLDAALAALALHSGHSLLVHSNSEAAIASRLAPNASLHVSPHPTYSDFRRGTWTRESSRRSLDLPHDGRVLLFFGLVRRYKGLDVLLKALPKVLAHVDCHLLVVGEFWKGREEYDSLLRELNLGDRVRIVDQYVPNEEVERYFSACDAVVLPYRTATQSGVAQIALGMAIPVISTQVGGIPDVVRHGYNGLLVPPDDPAALAAAIVQFFCDGRKARLEQGASTGRQDYTWDALIDTLTAIVKGP